MDIVMWQLVQKPALLIVSANTSVTTEDPSLLAFRHELRLDCLLKHIGSLFISLTKFGGLSSIIRTVKHYLLVLSDRHRLWWWLSLSARCDQSLDLHYILFSLRLDPHLFHHLLLSIFCFNRHLPDTVLLLLLVIAVLLQGRVLRLLVRFQRELDASVTLHAELHFKIIL